jgi:5,10-methylenetetrahydromethanopterin reductase
VKLGFGLLGDREIRESVSIARRAEALGYDSLWFAEHNFSRDGISACAATAFATERLIIGPAVIPIFTRSALLVATTFASLDELAEGRIVMGIGAGSRLLIQAQGVQYTRPLTALREYVEACRAVWNAPEGGHISYEGEIVQLRDAELDFQPRRRDIPIFLGPTGPKACALSGEIAEGALLNAFLPADYVRSAREWIAEGAARSGRDLAGFDTAMLCVTTVADSKDKAFDYLRPVVATYLARLPDIARHTSLSDDRWQQLSEAVAQGGGQLGQQYISDELLDNITVCGTPDECRQSIDRYVGAGVDHVILFTVGDIRRALEELAPAAG